MNTYLLQATRVTEAIPIIDTILSQVDHQSPKAFRI